MNRPETLLADTTPASGIVSAYRFDADGKAEPLPAHAVDKAIASGDGWCWIHLSHADARCCQWVERHAPLSEIVREILLGDEEHQRLEVYGREIVGVIPDLQLEFDRPTEQLSRLRFGMSEKLLVTMRRTPLRSVENVRRSIAAGTHYYSPMELVDAVIDHFGTVITQLSERVGGELDKAEERLWDNASGDESMRIARSRNQAVRVHRQLSQLRALFHRLEQRVAVPLPELAAAVQALAQKIDAFDNSVSAIHDRARLLQEEMAARMADVTNRRLLTLSVLTATFLPPTLVTGFFGMNTKDLPFQNSDGGTWFAFAIAAAAGAFTYWLVSRLR
jgi:zinc transporter